MQHITLSEYLSKTIAAKRLACRHEKNRKRFWSQAAIARRAGLSVGILGMLLNGQRTTCSAETVRKLAKGLRVSFQDVSDVVRVQTIATKEAEIESLRGQSSGVAA